MSKMGWGYGRQAMSTADRIRTGKKLIFETEGMKVYEYILEKCSRTYFNDLKIKYINNLKKGTKTIVITGLYKPQNYHCSEFKNQVELFNHVDELITEYIKCNSHLEYEYFQPKEDFMECLKYTNFTAVEELSSKDFSSLISKFFNCIKEFTTKEIREKIWNNIYKDIFDRSEYQDIDIVSLQCKYLDLCKKEVSI